MDAALKQRLVGAAVLVALAVIFLPMLVNGPEPEAGSSSVPMDIPTAPERDFETRELPLALPAPATSTPTPVPAATPDDPNRIVTVDAENAPRVDALPEDLAVSPPASATATPDEPAAAEASVTEPSSSAPSPAAAPPAPATTPGSRYAVNLGSYANAANASALVATLKSAGLAAYTETTQLDGKPVQRVRLGPYAQRGEAEAARLAAGRVRADLPASVVALDGEAATPAPVRAPVAQGYAVQIGALKSEADANVLRERARAAGFTTFVERAQTESGVLWRVRVGPELQRANAERIRASLAQKLKVDGVIVTHP